MRWKEMNNAFFYELFFILKVRCQQSRKLWGMQCIYLFSFNYSAGFDAMAVKVGLLINDSLNSILRKINSHFCADVLIKNGENYA